MSWQHLPFEPKDRQPIETHYHYHHHYSRVIDPEDDDFNWKTNDYLSPKVVKMPNQEFFVRELETDSRGRRKQQRMNSAGYTSYRRLTPTMTRITESRVNPEGQQSPNSKMVDSRRTQPITVEQCTNELPSYLNQYTGSEKDYIRESVLGNASFSYGLKCEVLSCDNKLRRRKGTKILIYEDQYLSLINRLRLYEQECNFLRKNFLKHYKSTHRKTTQP